MHLSGLTFERLRVSGMRRRAPVICKKNERCATALSSISCPWHLPSKRPQSLPKAYVGLSPSRAEDSPSPYGLPCRAFPTFSPSRKFPFKIRAGTY